MTIVVTTNNKEYYEKPDRDGMRRQTRGMTMQAYDELLFADMVSSLGMPFIGAVFDEHDKEIGAVGNSLTYRFTTLLALDFDNKDGRVYYLRQALKDAYMCGIPPYFSYYTFSSTMECPRFRLVWKTELNLNRGKDYYNRLLKKINRSVFHHKADKSGISAIKRWQGSNSGLQSYHRNGKLYEHIADD